MSVSQSIRDRRTLIVILVTCLLVTVVVNVLRRSNGHKEPSRWYYDVQSQELVVVSRRNPDSPITLPSGHQAYTAVVFGCGGCGDTGHRLFYLSRMEITEATAEPSSPAGYTGGGPISYVRTSDEQQWHNVASPQGQRIVDIRSRCSDPKLLVCDPD